MIINRRRIARRFERSSAAACVVAFFTAVPFPANAQQLSSEDWQRVEAGAAVANVAPAESPADGIVAAAVDIAAPPSRVWTVLTSCADAPSILPNLTYCGVIEEGAGGAWDVREHRLKWLAIMPEIRSQFRSDYVKPVSIHFSRVSGDMRALDGEWRLAPLAGGKATRLTYAARVGFGALIPGFVIRNALKADIPEFLAAIRKAAINGPARAASH